MTQDLLLQPVTKDTAINLTMVDGSFATWYPCVENVTFLDLVKTLDQAIAKRSTLRVGDPERYSDLCSIKWVNAGHIVSFQKAGGHR